MVSLDEIYHEMILVTLNEPYLSIKRDRKGGGGGGVSKTD